MTHKLEITAVFQAEGDPLQLKYAEQSLAAWLRWLSEYIYPNMEFEMITSVVEVKDGAENDQNLS